MIKNTPVLIRPEGYFLPPQFFHHKRLGLFTCKTNRLKLIFTRKSPPP